MSSYNLNTSELKHLIALEERKQSLVKLIEEIDQKIGKILGGFSSGGGASFKSAKTLGAKRGPKKGRGRAGGLKNKIVAALQAVGEKGITVKELAAKIGANPKNVDVWFYTTGKKVKGIKKIAPSTYRLGGGALPSAPAPKATASKPVKKGKPAKRGPKKGVKGSTKDRVLAELKNAGATGIGVKELAAKLQIKTQSLHNWFSQVGKKLPQIKRVGLGKYRVK